MLLTKIIKPVLLVCTRINVCSRGHIDAAVAAGAAATIDVTLDAKPVAFVAGVNDAMFDDNHACRRVTKDRRQYRTE